MRSFLPTRKNNQIFFPFFLFFYFFQFVSAEQFVIRDFSAYDFRSKNIFFENGAIKVFCKNQSTGPNDFFYGFDDKKKLESLDTSLVSISKDGFLGNSLSFQGISSHIDFLLPAVFDPLSPEYTGDFDLNIYIKPQIFVDGMRIVEGRSFVEKLNTDSYFEGFYLGVEDGNIVAHFENFFAFQENKVTFRLVSQNVLHLDEWNHIQLRYQRKTGMVELLLNDEIVDYFYATIDAQPNSLALFPGFRSRYTVDLELGEKYLGNIDEFSIKDFVDRKIEHTFSPNILDNLKSFTASYESRVFSLQPFSTIKSVELKGFLLDTEDIKVKICQSSNFFVAFEKEEKKNCRYVEIGEKIASEEGKYYQIFIDFFNKNSKLDMELKKLVLHYDVDLPPAAPQLLRVDSLGKKALIVWRRDFEKDIKGYNLYYSEEIPKVMGKNYKKKTIFIKALQEEAKKISPNAHHYFTFVKNLDLTKRYYFFMTSFDNIKDNGFQRESIRSNVVSIPISLILGEKKDVYDYSPRVVDFGFDNADERSSASR